MLVSMTWWQSPVPRVRDDTDGTDGQLDVPTSPIFTALHFTTVQFTAVKCNAVQLFWQSSSVKMMGLMNTVACSDTTVLCPKHCCTVCHYICWHTAQCPMDEHCASHIGTLHNSSVTLHNVEWWSPMSIVATAGERVGTLAWDVHRQVKPVSHFDQDKYKLVIFTTLPPYTTMQYYNIV